MAFFPTLVASRGKYMGGIITPSGFRYYYGSTLPDNFVAVVNISTNKSGDEYISYAMEVLKDTIYDSHELSIRRVLPVVRYTSRENAKKLALNSIGYPCSVLGFLGAKFVRYLNNSIGMYEIDGEYLYCNPLESRITNDPNRTFYQYHVACLMARYPSKFVIRDGKIYLVSGLAVADISKETAPFIGVKWTITGDPKYLLSWENMFEIICEISKIK